MAITAKMLVGVSNEVLAKLLVDALKRANDSTENLSYVAEQLELVKKCAEELNRRGETEA